MPSGPGIGSAWVIFSRVRVRSSKRIAPTRLFSKAIENISGVLSFSVLPGRSNREKGKCDGRTEGIRPDSARRSRGPESLAGRARGSPRGSSRLRLLPRAGGRTNRARTSGPATSRSSSCSIPGTGRGADAGARAGTRRGGPFSGPYVPRRRPHPAPRRPVPLHDGTAGPVRRSGEAGRARQRVGRGGTENFAEPGAREGPLRISPVSEHHEGHLPSADSPRGRHAQYGPSGSALPRHGRHALRTAFRARISSAEHGHRPSLGGHSTHVGRECDDFRLCGRSVRSESARATSA